MTNPFLRVELHSDGACLGNPGPGGWACILRPEGQLEDERVLVGGEAESEKVRRLANKFPNPRLRILLNEPLTSVARELTGCKVFVGHDSGITHLAAALGVRCVVLWAQTNERVWRPPGELVHILKPYNNTTPVEPRVVFKFVKNFTSVH